MLSDKTKSLEERAVYHFTKLCGIPHGSFNEKGISDYLCEWARGLGLRAVQDEHLNVVVYKEASPGKERAGAVLLQAHIDMVCEKAPDYQHDFRKDPIPYQIEGDIISTGGKTTLGADDGIGVALIMAVLESEVLAHPRLEAAFTTAEEEDLSGALSIDGALFTARRMINIDHVADNEVVLGSCGGMAAEIALPVERVPLPGGYICRSVALSGLPGGHSGENIHSGNGNAIVLIGRILRRCEPLGALIADISGGSFRTAIPREASVTVAVPRENCAAFDLMLEEIGREFKEEYLAAAPELRLSAAEAAASQVLSAASTKRLIHALCLSPDGISAMSDRMAHIVESSDNLGELHLEEDVCRIIYEIRSTYPSTASFIADKIALIGELLGGEFRTFGRYPGWSYDPGSKMKKISNRVYAEEFGEEQKNVVLHAGLECGCFYDAIPGLDAISVGPNTWNLHSPSEHMSISSVGKMAGFLAKLLEELALDN